MEPFISERIQLFTSPLGSYFYVNLSKLKESEVLELIIGFTFILKDYELNSVLVLADTTDMSLSLSTLTSLKGVSKEIQTYVYRLAVLGGSRFVKTFMPMYKKITESKAVFFGTGEQGLRHLFSP